MGRWIRGVAWIVRVACGVRRIAWERKLSEKQRVRQPVFARYLNTSESTIEKREAGVKKPSGMALKLLDIVEKHGLKVLA